MGIHIQYKGSLDDPSRLNEALEEIRGFCKRVGWKYEDCADRYSGVILSDAEDAGKDEPDPEPWPDEVPSIGGTRFWIRVSKRRPPKLVETSYPGIQIHPPGMHPVRLTFNEKGRLSWLREAPARIVIDAIPGTAHYIAWPLEMNTSGATDAHVGICLLFRLLRDKYMSNLELEDDSGFWDSGDLDELRRGHRVMGALLGMTRDSESLNALLQAAGIPAGSRSRGSRSGFREIAAPGRVTILQIREAL